VRAEGKATEEIQVRFTQAGKSLYATLMETPANTEIELLDLQVSEGTTVYLLGREAPLAWEQRGEALAIALPGRLHTAPAHAFRITPQPQASGSILVARAGTLSIDSKLHDILNDEAGKAVIEEHVPGMLDSSQIEMAMGFSLPQIARFVPDVLTDEIVAAIGQELAKL
jgi:hypothetical protein